MKNFSLVFIILSFLFFSFTIIAENSDNLQWSKKSSNLQLKDAKKYCENLVENGYDDWRLPNIDELRTLLKDNSAVSGGSCKVIEKNNCSAFNCWDLENCAPSCDPVTLNCDYPHNLSKLGDTDMFWSSTAVSDEPEQTWYINFGQGNIFNTKHLIGPGMFAFSRCVRGKYNEKKYVAAGQKMLENIKKVEEKSHQIERTKINKEAKRTGLHWSMLAKHKKKWLDAVNYCENLKEDGHEDWRLPTIGELRTLIKNCQKTVVGGVCKVSDKCLYQDCFNAYQCFCEQDHSGKYSRLEDGGTLWSSSPMQEILGQNKYYFAVDFEGASITLFDADFLNPALNVRCIRDN